MNVPQGLVSIALFLEQKVEDIPSGSRRLHDFKRIVFATGRWLPGEIHTRSNRLRNVAYEYVTMRSEGTRGKNRQTQGKSAIANSSVDANQDV